MATSLFAWLVADVFAGGWFVLREKYCWLVADKPSEQGASFALVINWHHLDILPQFQIKCIWLS
jgi:hypothetical protein